MNRKIPEPVIKILTKIEIRLVCGLVLLSILACSPTLFIPAPTPTQPIASVTELQFKDSKTGRRFRALNSCIKNIVDDSWHTVPYQLMGNFYTSSWCSGAGARSDCQIMDSILGKRNQHIIRLNTLFYSQDFPDVFGLGFQALWVPKTTGWGALFSFSEGGGSVMGDGWGVTFPEYTTPAGDPISTVDLGWNYSYTIYGPNRTSFDYSSDLSLRDDLALYLSSPEAMRDRGLEHIQALAQKVDMALNTHQVITCDLGPYLGKGVPPACTPRPLTPVEESAELTRADAYFVNQEQLLRDHYQEMYTAWIMAFPLDRCWP
jgi:hypothetical protein